MYQEKTMETCLQSVFNMQSDMEIESNSILFQKAISVNYIKFQYSVDHSQSESHVQTCSPVYKYMTSQIVDYID